MTSLNFDPASFGPPSEPEPREQLIVNGRYMLPPIGDPTGKRRSLQRVTNFVKQLSETGGLERWKLRTTVVGLARDERRYDLACSLDPNTEQGKRDLDKLIEECIDFGQAGPSGGNITGTALHNLTDDVAGSYPIRVRDKWTPKLENYFAALHAKGLRVVPGLSERLVVSERYGTCGRLDDVYEDPFGVLRVGDRKSQKDFQTWWEVGAQLALYQCSDAMWNEQTSDWEEMPALAGDLVHVAWMPLKHPAAKKGGNVDTVTIYDLPLEGPREVLEWCLKVRTLRTGARQWGQERVDLDEFATLARDIRDAETHEDLAKLGGRVSAFAVGDNGGPLMEMASARWEAIAAQPKPEPVVEAAAASQVYANNVVDDFACRFDGKRVSEHPISIPGHYACISPEPWPADHPDAPWNRTAEQIVIVPPHVQTEVSPGISVMHGDSGNLAMNVTRDGDAVVAYRNSGPMPQEEILRRREIAYARLDAAGEKAKKINATVSADHFDPALFVSPSEDASFSAGEAVTRVDNGSPVTNPLAASTHEERQALREQQWVDGEGMRRKPMEWATHLGLTDFALEPGVDAESTPLTLKDFRRLYAREVALADIARMASPELKTPEVWAAEWGFAIVDAWGWTDQCTLGEKNYNEPISREEFGVRMRQSSCRQLTSVDAVDAARQQAHPVATTSFTHAKHHGATVVELPGDEEARLQEIERRQSSPIVPAETDYLANAIEALDSVPLKVVAEVCKRANNSQSSRGRVRLLNDVEDKKYAAHGVELLPALLREWLTNDQGATSTGFVKLTEGSSRQAMHESRAGVLSLTEYLATKEGPKSATVTEETEAPAVPDSEAVTRMAEGLAEKAPGFASAVAEVRKPYVGLAEGPNAGKHSMARLLELAKDARNERERLKVFRAIGRLGFTGEIAAELGQHYLDAGQPAANFDPYFAEPRSEYTYLGTTTESGEYLVNDQRLATLLLDAHTPDEVRLAEAEIERREELPRGLPSDPDDPATAADALHLVEGIEDRGTLALIWQQLSTKPYWNDQALQEGLLTKMVSLK